MHSGIRDTLDQMRERHWVLKGSQLVKRVVSRCFICRKLKVKPVEQATAPWPRDRVTESPPFEVTGVDFAGPLYARTAQESIHCLSLVQSLGQCIYCRTRPLKFSSWLKRVSLLDKGCVRSFTQTVPKHKRTLEVIERIRAHKVFRW